MAWLGTGKRRVGTGSFHRIERTLASALGVGLGWVVGGCNSNNPTVVFNAKANPASADAGVLAEVEPDPTPWVNHAQGRSVYAIVDGTHDVWVGSEVGLARYQKQSGKWRYYNHGNSDLPCNHVLSLALDTQGAVWIGTRHNGLAKFDGRSWMRLPLPNQQNYGPEARTLYVDPQGTLWVGADHGSLHAWDGSRWQSYDIAGSVVSSTFLSGVVRDPQGQLWVATAQGLGTLDLATGQWRKDFEFPLGGSVYQVLLDVSGRLWVATPRGLACREAGTWTTYNTWNSGLPSNTVIGLGEDGLGGMWIGTCDGLLHLTGQSWQLQTAPGKPTQGDCIAAVAASSDGTTWVGTLEEGLMRLDHGRWKTERISQSELASNSVYALVEDNQGTMWTAGKRGLTKWQKGQGSVLQDKNSPLSPDCTINALAMDADNTTLWIGTEDGLVRYDGKNWQVYDTKNSVLPSSEILSLLTDSSGRLWIGTSDGLAALDKTNWQVFTSSNSRLPSNSVSGLALDPRGPVWIGLLMDPGNMDGHFQYVGGGLVKYDGQTFQVVTEASSNLPTNHVIGLAADEKGVLWIATGSPAGPSNQSQGGVVRYDGLSWQVYSSQNSPLPNNYVQCVTVNGHTVWVGTYQGLAAYDGSRWQVWHHHSSGLSDEVIWNILVDRRGNTWIGTGFEGLSIFRQGGVDFGR